MSELGPKLDPFTFTVTVQRNVLGGGYFAVVTLRAPDGTKRGQWTYDGTLTPAFADWRASRKVKQLRRMYEAVPA